MPANLPPGWRKVRLPDVLPEKMLQELVDLHHRDALTMDELRRLCHLPENAEHMKDRGLLPDFCPYWLAHHLKVQR